MAYEENLECTAVADVTDSGRMIIEYRGQHIVDCPALSWIVPVLARWLPL